MGALLSLPLDQGKDWLRWHADNLALRGSPDCSDTAWYRELPPGDAEAFHEYREKNNPSVIYGAGNTVDHERRTAWVVRIAHRADQDWVSWTLPRKRHLSLICIRPGFTRDYATYAGNGRPRDAVLIGCGKSERPIRFEDQVNLKTKKLTANWPNFVSIPVNCTTGHIRLRIKSTYLAYDKSHLVAISDVRFFGSWQFTGN